MYYKDLEAWKKSIELVTLIYKITENFPQSEQYGITNQMRRAAVSIPSNIAEGSSRHSDKETLRFLDISLGALAELETQIIISETLGYLNNKDNLLQEIKAVNALLSGLYAYLSRSSSKNP